MMMPFCCAIGSGSHVTVAERELLATAAKFCGYDVGTVEKKWTVRFYLFNCSKYSKLHSATNTTST